MIQKTKADYLREHKSWGNIKVINIPAKDERLAELVGIILGDGNIHVYQKSRDISYYSLRIAGNYIKDYEYLTKYVANLCEDLFLIKAKFYKQPKTNCLYILLQGRLVIDFLINIGLKSGNKIKSQVTIPKWIWENDNYLKFCVRGLIDTDGCIYEMTPHWPGLFQLNFENRNFTLLKDTRNALINLVIHHQKSVEIELKMGLNSMCQERQKSKNFIKRLGLATIEI